MGEKQILSTGQWGEGGSVVTRGLRTKSALGSCYLDPASCAAWGKGTQWPALLVF